MKARVSKALLIGLFAAAGILGSGAVWLHGFHDTSRELTTLETDRFNGERNVATREDIAALNAQIALVSKRVEDMGHRFGGTTRQLNLLQVQLAQIEEEHRRTLIPEPLQEDWDALAIEADVEMLGTEENWEQQVPKHTQARMRAQAELIEDIMQSEYTDPEWANSAEIALDETFLDDKFSEFQVIGSECSGTLCRVRFYLDNVELAQGGIEKLARVVPALPWVGESWLKVENTESGEAVLYLAREGYSLPR